MRFWWVTLCWLLVAPALVRAADEADRFAYTPPIPPSAPNPLNLLIRLVLITLFLAGLCIGIIWWSKRSARRRIDQARNDGKMTLEGSVVLDRRSTLHIIQVEGQSVAVATDGSGFRSMVVLSESFENLLEDDQAEPTPPATEATTPGS